MKGGYANLHQQPISVSRTWRNKFLSAMHPLTRRSLSASAAPWRTPEFRVGSLPRNIEPGTDFPTAIVEAINSAHAFVLILTEHAAASPHVLSEVGHAFNGKKRIIPFRISQQALPEDLEYFLSLTQWLDAPDGCTDQNLKRLIDATLAALAGERAPRPLAPRKSRARWLAGAILTLVVVAGMIVFLKSRKPPGRNPALPTSTGVTTSPPSHSPGRPATEDLAQPR